MRVGVGCNDIGDIVEVGHMFDATQHDILKVAHMLDAT